MRDGNCLANEKTPRNEFQKMSKLPRKQLKD